MSLGLPLIAWGAAEDVSTWTSAGTPIVTAGQTDPFGGTSAYLVNDDDAGQAEGKYAVLGALGLSTLFDVVGVRANTAAGSALIIYDATAAVAKAVVDIAWSGGVPSPSFSSGSGTVWGSVALGGGWYAILYSATGLTAANTHRRYFYPAGGAAANTGSTYLYVQNLVLLDYLDSPVGDDVPREGSRRVQFASGVEDAWTVGPDYRLTANVRYIPTTPQTSPVVVSGWDGRNEATGVNCGVAAMLRAGRTMTALRYVPDRSTCTTYLDSYLRAPLDEAPTLEEGRNPQRTFSLVLWNASSPYEGVL